MAQPKTPKKYRQAKTDAKKAAKKVFSGKKRAVAKDPYAKTDAEARKALSDVAKESRGGYITDEKGNKIKVEKGESYAERTAREREAALRRFREGEAAEQRASEIEKRMEKNRATKIASNVEAKAEARATGKKGSPLVQTAGADRAPKTTAKKAPAKKAPAKPSVKKAAPKTKPIGTAPKDVAEKGVKGVKAVPLPKKKAAPAPKPGKFAAGEIKTPEETARYKAARAAGKSPAEAYAIAKGGAGKTVAVVPKGTKAVAPKTGTKAVTPAKPKAAWGNGVGEKVGKAVIKGGRFLGGRYGLLLTAGSLAAGPIIDAIRGKGKSGAGAAPSGAKSKANDRLYPQGTKPKTTTTRTGEENRRPMQPSGSVKSSGGKGAITGNVYRVEHNDTLPAIARRAGVSLAELKKANPKAFSQKYIYRNTKIIIPQGGKVPSGGYTGPTPYVPGSKAAKKYEATLPASKRDKSTK